MTKKTSKTSSSISIDLATSKRFMEAKARRTIKTGIKCESITFINDLLDKFEGRKTK